MNELHLFAGAGGGILGGHLLGHTCVCAVEIDKYCRRVLLQRQRDGVLPRFPIWDDIRTFDGTPWRGRVDVVCGGFPCQDISAAGKGAGITGERSGLWSEMARVVREVQPQYVFVENSPLLIQRGLGLVLTDLAEMGFDAAWGIVSAEDAAFAGGTPAIYHERKRLWLLAESTDSTRIQQGRHEQRAEWQRAGTCGESFTEGTDTAVERLQGSEQKNNDSEQWTRTGGVCKSTDAKIHRRRKRRTRRLDSNGAGECEQALQTGDTNVTRLEIRQGESGYDGAQQQTIERAGWWESEPAVGRVAHELASGMVRNNGTEAGDV